MTLLDIDRRPGQVAVEESISLEVDVEMRRRSALPSKAGSSRSFIPSFPPPTVLDSSAPLLIGGYEADNRHYGLALTL